MKSEVTVHRRKNIHLVPPSSAKKNMEIFLFQTISKTISYLSQGREGGLVIDVDECTTILTTTTTMPCSSPTSTRTTTPVPTIPSTIPTLSSTTTAIRPFETGINFKVDLVLLLGTGLGSGLGFSDKIGVFLFIFGKRDCVFPEIITSTFVGLASVFQLGDN
jgi:hypothetical protein